MENASASHSSCPGCSQCYHFGALEMIQELQLNLEDGYFNEAMSGTSSVYETARSPVSARTAASAPSWPSLPSSPRSVRFLMEPMEIEEEEERRPVRWITMMFKKHTWIITSIAIFIAVAFILVTGYYWGELTSRAVEDDDDKMRKMREALAVGDGATTKFDVDRIIPL